MKIFLSVFITFFLFVQFHFLFPFLIELIAGFKIIIFAILGFIMVSILYAMNKAIGAEYFKSFSTEIDGKILGSVSLFYRLQD